MKLAALHLPRLMLLVVSAGLASCSTAPAPSPPKTVTKAEPKKDYSALRISGREELQLPGIGLVHADKRENVQGGAVLLSGRVFLEISPSDIIPILGKPQFAYAEKARWNSVTGVLCLEDPSVIEFDHAVSNSTDAGTQVFFDRSGKITTQGGHETIFY